jgi:ketosteroid isomerase-like protein
MNQNNVAIAEAYYNAMSNKNMAEVERYLHPDVHFLAPLAKLTGKEAVLEAAQGFSHFFNSLTIRAKFGEADQAMVVYEVDCPVPVGLIRTAALMTFKEGLIARIELFYDARPFEMK